MTKRFSKFPRTRTSGYFVVFGKADWATMESKEVYGQKLSKEIRDLISLATLYLTVVWPEEQSAPRLDGETAKRLEQLMKISEQLRSELFPRHQWLPEYQVNFRPTSAKTSLQLELDTISDSDDDSFALLRANLTSIIEIGNEIFAQVRKVNFGHRDGRAWEVWVVLMTIIMKSQELPIGIRSDSYRVSSEGGSPQPSPFVRLIKYLQKYALKEKKKFHSAGALAKEIQRARSLNFITDEVNKDNVKQFMYRIVGVPHYTGLRNESSDMEYMVYWVLEGIRVGFHSVAPDRSFFYSEDVPHPDADNQKAIAKPPKRRRRRVR